MMQMTARTLKHSLVLWQWSANLLFSDELWTLVSVKKNLWREFAANNFKVSFLLWMSNEYAARSMYNYIHFKWHQPFADSFHWILLLLIIHTKYTDGVYNHIPIS